MTRASNLKKTAGLLLLLLALLFPTSELSARPNFNIDSLSFKPISGTEGCWGYVDSATSREYALICATNWLEIWDVTDPFNPFWIKIIPATGYELKQIRPYSSYLFAVNQYYTGLQIIDASAIFTIPDEVATVATYSTNSNYGGAHTVHIDGHYAYVALNGNVPASWRIIDISDPYTPVEVGSYLTSVTAGYVQSHDSYVKGDTAYVAFLSGGFSIVDITNKSSPVRLADVYYPNAFTHNCWTTEDGKYVFTTDENTQGSSTPSGYLRVWDVRNPDSVRQVAEWKSPSPGAVIHNVQVKGNYLYVAYYTDGVVILDIEDPTQPVEVGHYDTTPLDSTPGYNGCWDIFPYFPSGTLVASNRSTPTGMWLLHFDSAKTGYLRGAVTNWVTAESLGNVNLRFIDVWRQVKTDSVGNYLVRTEGGNVHIEFFKEGFRPETVTVAALLNDTTDIDTVRLVPLTEFPAAPSNSNARPDAVGNIYLSWQPSNDTDLLRFRIYRTSLADTANFSLFDSVAAAETSYTDFGAVPGERFSYRITAVDSSGLESFPSIPVKAMRFVFGNRILLVDRTRYSTFKDSLAARDSLSRFHRRLLRRFDFDSLDLNDTSFPLTAHNIDPSFVSQHPVIVGHSCENGSILSRDNPSFLTYFNDFLKAGGKLILAGHWPFSFSPQISILCYYDPFILETTSPDAWEALRAGFGFECLFSTRSYPTDSSLATQSFLYAEPIESGYPQLQADSTRVDLFARTIPEDRHYQFPTLPNVGYMTNRNPSEDLYHFGSILGEVDDKHGQTVAKKHIDASAGGGFVWFNFPLYFMQEDSSKKAFLQAMADLGVPENFQKGDFDRNGVRDILDIPYLTNYVFLGLPFEIFDASEADMNCNGQITAVDVVLLLMDIFSSKPLPCN